MASFRRRLLHFKLVILHTKYIATKRHLKPLNDSTAHGYGSRSDCSSCVPAASPSCWRSRLAALAAVSSWNSSRAAGERGDAHVSRVPGRNRSSLSQPPRSQRVQVGRQAIRLRHINDMEVERKT